MTKTTPTPSLSNSRPVLKQAELPLPTILTGEAARPQCVFAWDPLAEGEFDPNSRYPEMKVEGERLHEHLHRQVNKAIRSWQKLPDKPGSVTEAVRIKDTCLLSILNAHDKVLRPGMDRSALSHATALCANAIRTITVLCNHIIDWSESSLGSTVSAVRSREFDMSRFFAGMRSYGSSQLPRGMLPFGGGRKLTPIRRETPDDPRLLANIFAGNPDTVSESYAKILQRLKGPALASHLRPGSDEDEEFADAGANAQWRN